MTKLKFVLLFALIALLAGACGGSDDDTDSAAEDPTEEAAQTDDGDSNDDDTTGSDDTATGDDTSDIPPPPEVVQVQERDCAHTSAELASNDPEEANTEEEPEVELPPQEKPAIEDDYLGSFDELVTRDLIEGTGETAVAGANVTMQYVGVLATDGTEFDASWNSGNPFTFTLGQDAVIEGWHQGIEGMKVGGRRLLQIPSDLAYGEQQRSEIIVPNSDLVFVVDLIEIAAAPDPAPPVEDDYLGSFDALETVELVEGEGCEAQYGDIVSVNYVGVDAETGEEFDSSWSRSELFPLIVGRSQVIDGWNQGIEGMKVGGERILQIPADLAYGDGDLVFRVHLEELIEAPVAHTVEFDGDAPSDVEVTTLVEGDGGEQAEAGDIIDANITVLLWDSGLVLQSTWQDGVSAQLALEGPALLPGLVNNIEGTTIGETRQIVVPATMAYPEGIPAQTGIQEGDALVFVVQLVDIVG